MDKVKQIFKSDDSSKGTTTGNNLTSTTSPSATRTGGDIDNVGSNTHSHSHSHNHGVDTVGSTTTGSDTSSTGRRGSLGGHRHNIEQHHSLDGVKDATHDHKHLAAVTREKHHTHETEEVQREREHDRHIHHIQHHVQPVLDEKHHDREHAQTVHPVTHVREQHVNTDEDVNLFKGLGAHHKDEQLTGSHDRSVVDKGEIVKENISHHVHHVVQPVIERDTHHHKTIHTTIPVKHTTHEAPIVHQSSTHEPMHIKDFVAQGGDLKSKLTHDNAGVLAQGDCARDVDGPAEQLADKLHLGGATHTHTH